MSESQPAATFDYFGLMSQESVNARVIKRKLWNYLEQRNDRICVSGKWRAVRLLVGDEVKVGQLKLKVTALSQDSLVLTACQPGTTPREYCLSKDAKIAVRDGEVLINAEKSYVTATMFSVSRDWSVDIPFEDGSVDYGSGAIPHRGCSDVSGSCKVITNRGEVELRWAEQSQSLDVFSGGVPCGVVTGHALLEVTEKQTRLFDDFLLIRYDADNEDLIVIAGDVLFDLPAGEDPVIAKARTQSRRVILTEDGEPVDNFSAVRQLEDDYTEEESQIVEEVFCWGSRKTSTPAGEAGLARLLGHRGDMEDEVAVVGTPSGATIAAVFDGHYCRRAAGISKETVEQELPRRLDSAPHRTAEALCEVLEEAHQRTMQEAESSGSTAVIVAIVEEDGQKRLYSANVGDSRAVLGTKQGEALRLTYDHKPYELDEAYKVFSRGGWVHDDRVDSHMALSRAIGDSLHIGMGHDAEVSCVTLEPSARFLILATDGLWDVIFDEEAVEFVSLCLDADLDLEETARRLCELALIQGSEDNISVVVVSLRS